MKKDSGREGAAWGTAIVCGTAIVLRSSIALGASIARAPIARAPIARAPDMNGAIPINIGLRGRA